jgi:hypothetical protein
MIVTANMWMGTEGRPALRPVEARYADSANTCTAYYKLTDNACFFVYDFQRPQVKIPVKYTLTDTGFSVEILNNEIDEYGAHKLLEIRFLPAFGAGGPDDSGYMLIPDGAGALINFNNNKAGVGKLDGSPVYGFNAGTNDLTTSTLEQYKATKSLGLTLNMPLWGMKVNDTGFLAVITGGAARGFLNAQSGGQGCSYNMAYSGCKFRFTGSIRMLTKGFNQTMVSITEQDLDLRNNFMVEYNFLDNGSAAYTDMARFYREKYLNLAKLEKSDIPFYLDIYGFIVKSKPRLGIPMDTVIPLTTYKQAEEIIDELTTGGVKNINVRYNYWQKGGYYGKLNRTRSLRTLGGTRKLRALNEKITGLGGGLFLTHEPLNVYRTGGGFRPLFDALKTVARTTQRQYQFSLANASTDSRYDPWFLVRPQKIDKFFNGFLKKFDNRLGSIALNSIGEMLYSELATDGVHRDDVLADIKAQLGKVDKLMLNGAFDYAAAYANHVVNTPLRSGGTDIYDAEIPFWQIMFHGYLDYSFPAVNLSSNPSQMILKNLETGASPMFSWAFQNIDELIGSRSDDLFSADYSKWLAQAVSDYVETNAVLSKARGLPITAHERNGNTSVTEYGGSITVICDYDAKSYRVVEK